MKAVLITGASAGIGEEFARQLATQGHNLVLAARRLDRLETLASELRQRHNLEVVCIASDLAQAGASEKLVADMATHNCGTDWLDQQCRFWRPGGFFRSVTTASAGHDPGECDCPGGSDLAIGAAVESGP